jgi:gamma-glutamyl-gamma-aminobutyrate hydrolase PuuD
MSSAPLIAIAGFVKEVAAAPGLREPAVLAYMRYVDAVRRAGGLPVVLPYSSAGALDRFDGVVLMGGGDVDPSAYARPDDGSEGVNAERDEAELALVARAIEGGMPTLAICRGVQVLNVALGGTLHQHIGDGVHRLEPGHGLLHPIRAEAGSRMAAACGTQFDAWSSHHQAVDELGAGLVSCAWAPDGTIEGVELPERWVVGVQWHPERTAHEDPAQLALFEALVRATRSVATA